MGKVISGVSSLWGGNQGAKTADRAANHQISGMEDAQRQFAPYQQVGIDANKSIQDHIASGRLGGQFNPSDLANDPGYQFELAQGKQAMDRMGSARGNYFSGEAIKEATQFGQGLANKNYNQAFQRNLLDQSNLYNILSGQQGVGFNAASANAGLAAGKGEAAANRVVAKNNAKTGGIAGALGAFF